MKKLFVISVLLGFAAVLPAQNKVYHVPVKAQTSIVREYIPESKWIVCYESLTSAYHFALTDLNVFTDVEIGGDYEVKDFEVIDDTVIFCGTMASNEAFLAWFPVAAFFSGSSPYYIDTLNLCGLQSLDNIEVFRNPTTSHIHIVGYGYEPTPDNNYCAFEATCALHSFASASYRIKPLDCLDMVLDMAVTDNYVVLGGRNDGVNVSQINTLLFPYSKYNMLGTTGDSYYQFATSSLVETEPSLNQLRVTLVNGDTIATVSFRQGISANNACLTIRKYDMAHGAIMCAPLKVGVGQSPGLIRGFEYDKVEATFYVLNPYRYLASAQALIGVITRIDYSLGIPPVVYNDLDPSVYCYHSMCGRNIGYLASGNLSSGSELVLYRGKAPYQTNCAPNFQDVASSDNVISPLINTCIRSASLLSQIGWMSKPILSINQYVTNIICE